MRRISGAMLAIGLLSSPAMAAGYDKTETTKIYTLHLRIPQTAMTIAPLKTEIFSRWKRDSNELEQEAKEEFDAKIPDFHPFDLDTTWRVTFESPTAISLSADSFIDEDGAHPNGAFDAIVWDKTANRAVPFEALFNPAQAKTAFTAIAAFATKIWTKEMTVRAGEAPFPDEAGQGIGADPAKLGHYALIFEKGDTKANAIVLLYGAGEIWPHAAGDFRLVIPETVFRAYLTPRWRAEFK
jgi:hypothetical protein